jgi:phage-related protein
MEVVYATGDISRFLDGLEAEVRSQVARLLNILVIRGHELRLPHSRALGSGLFELRLMGSHPVRLLYCFHVESAYILHAVIKKRNALASKDIARARIIHRMVLDRI